MRHLLFEYNYNFSDSSNLAPLSDVLVQLTPYWYSLRPKNFPLQDGEAVVAAAAAAAEMPAAAAVDMPAAAAQPPPPPPPAAAAAAANESKFNYTPAAYQSMQYFVLKPGEWFYIVFAGGEKEKELRPDFVYEVKPSWPTLGLRQMNTFLGLIGQNNFVETHICVHQGALLGHLLQMEEVYTCFTMFSRQDMDKIIQTFNEQQCNEEDNNIDDADDDDDDDDADDDDHHNDDDDDNDDDDQDDGYDTVDSSQDIQVIEP